jgi:hypothetical protein
VALASVSGLHCFRRQGTPLLSLLLSTVMVGRRCFVSLSAGMGHSFNVCSGLDCRLWRGSTHGARGMSACASLAYLQFHLLMGLLYNYTLSVPLASPMAASVARSPIGVMLMLTLWHGGASCAAGGRAIDPPLVLISRGHARSFRAHRICPRAHGTAGCGGQRDGVCGVHAASRRLVCEPTGGWWEGYTGDERLLEHPEQLSGPSAEYMYSSS